MPTVTIVDTLDVGRLVRRLPGVVLITLSDEDVSSADIAETIRDIGVTPKEATEESME